MSGIEILFLAFGIMVFISIFLLMYAPSALESKETEVIADKNLSEQASDFIENTTNPAKQIVTVFFVGIGFIILYPIISVISNYSQPIRYILISLFYITPIFAMWYKVRYNNNGFMAVIISILVTFTFIHLSKMNGDKDNYLVKNTAPTKVYRPESSSKNLEPQISSAADLARRATGKSKVDELKSIDDSVTKNKNEVHLAKKDFEKMSLDEQLEHLGEDLARSHKKIELTEAEAKKHPYQAYIMRTQQRLRESENHTINHK